MQQEMVEVFTCGGCGGKFFNKNDCAICEQFDCIVDHLMKIYPDVSFLEAKRKDVKAMIGVIKIFRSMSQELWGEGSQFKDFDISCLDELPAIVKEVAPKVSSSNRGISI
jgi:hypothetical protein